MDLADFKVTVEKSTSTGLWLWEVVTPDGLTIHADLAYAKRENAEDAALDAIKRYEAPETLDGAALKQRVEARAA